MDSIGSHSLVGEFVVNRVIVESSGIVQQYQVAPFDTVLFKTALVAEDLFDFYPPSLQV